MPEPALMYSENVKLMSSVPFSIVAPSAGTTLSAASVSPLLSVVTVMEYSSKSNPAELIRKPWGKVMLY